MISSYRFQRTFLRFKEFSYSFNRVFLPTPKGNIFRLTPEKVYTFAFILFLNYFINIKFVTCLLNYISQNCKRLKFLDSEPCKFILATSLRMKPVAVWKGGGTLLQRWHEKMVAGIHLWCLSKTEKCIWILYLNWHLHFEQKVFLNNFLNKLWVTKIGVHFIYDSDDDGIRQIVDNILRVFHN